MRLSAVGRYQYKSKYWDYYTTVSTEKDANGNDYEVTTYNHYFSRFVECHVTSDSGNRLSIFTIEPLRINSRISEIETKNKVKIFDKQFWEVTAVEPVLSALGTVEGYRSVASLVR